MGTCCPRALRCVPLCHVTLRGGDRLEEGGSTSSAPQHEIDERPNHRVSFFFFFFWGGGGGGGEGRGGGSCRRRKRCASMSRVFARTERAGVLASDQNWCLVLNLSQHTTCEEERLFHLNRRNKTSADLTAENTSFFLSFFQVTIRQIIQLTDDDRNEI